MKKKIFAMLALAILLALSMAPAAWAATVASGECGAEGDNVTWVLDDTGTLTISGTGAMADFEENLFGKGTPWKENLNSIININILNGITTIGENAFERCEKLNEVTIPNSVTSIGSRAFWNCQALNNITIPDSVTSIGSGAFELCTGIEEINIPNKLTIIEDKTFNHCSSLKNIIIPNSVTGIGYGAFGYCNKITNITIPDKVTDIASSAFNDCSSLTKIDVATNNINFASEDGVLFNKEKTILLKFPEAKSDTYNIPNSVTEIAEDSFWACENLNSVTIPNRVKSIGTHAFWGCSNLVDIDIPNSVENIDFGAFRLCKNLLSLKIPDGITSIQDTIFSECSSLKNIIIPQSVESIGYQAFVECLNLSDIYYGGSKEQWQKVIINNSDNGNAAIFNATIHYNSTGPETPTKPDTTPSELVQKFVNIAIAQVGKTRSDFGFTDAWCGRFVGWCAEQVGAQNLIGTAKSAGNCSLILDKVLAGGGKFYYYEDYNITQNRSRGEEVKRGSFVPQIGDIIFLKNWHLGIVVGVDVSANRIEVAHGNWHINKTGTGVVCGPNCCNCRYWTLEGKSVGDNQTAYQIFAYMRPNWSSTETSSGTRTDIYKVPGDVRYTYKDEVLDSATNKLETNFGAMEKQSDDTLKVTLNGYYDADIVITGTGNGVMDITSIYTNADGKRTVSTLEGVAINSNTICELYANDLADTEYLKVYKDDKETLKEVWKADENNTVTEPDTELTKWFSTGVADDLSQTYTINYDTDNGILVGISNPDHVTKGEIYTMPNANKSGYTLKHWAIGAKDSANTVKANDAYTFTEDTTVYAVWDKNSSGGSHSGGSHRNPNSGGGTTTPTKPGETTKPGTTSEKPGTTTNKPSGTVTALNINNVFADVKNGEWYSEAVAYVYNKGMMNGTEKGFEPNAATTRAMLVTMLYRLEGEPNIGAANFSDVASGQWFSKAIAWANANGVVNGYADGKFGPNDALTREQLAAVLYRYAQAKGMDVSAKGDLSGFNDSAKVSGWATEAMQWAVGAGIINGDNGALKPAGNATRAEVAMMIMRFDEM